MNEAVWLTIGAAVLVAIGLPAIAVALARRSADRVDLLTSNARSAVELSRDLGHPSDPRAEPTR